MFDAHFHLDFFPKTEQRQLITDAQKNGLDGGLIAGVWPNNAKNLFDWVNETENENSKKCDNVPNYDFRNYDFRNYEFIPKDRIMTPDFPNQSLDHVQKKFSLFASIGLHPWYQREHWLKPDGSLSRCAMDEDFACFEKILHENSRWVWAIGETGFDLHRMSGREKEIAGSMQRAAFEFCIDIAARKNLPLIVHTRNAWQRTLDMLFSTQRITPALIHCYGGPSECFLELRKRNIFVSFGGPATWKNANKLRAVVRQCPSDILMLETDAPDLPPEFADGTKPKRNEPWMLNEIAQNIAQLRGALVSELKHQSDTNFFRWLGVYSAGHQDKVPF